MSAASGPKVVIEPICRNCGKIAKKLKKCSKCRSIQYCNRECQAAHWPWHRQHCSQFRSENTKGLLRLLQTAEFADILEALAPLLDNSVPLDYAISVMRAEELREMGVETHSDETLGFLAARRIKDAAKEPDVPNPDNHRQIAVTGSNEGFFELRYQEKDPSPEAVRILNYLVLSNPTTFEMFRAMKLMFLYDPTIEGDVTKRLYDVAYSE